MTFVFEVVARRLAWRHGHWGARFTDQLHAGFVQAHLWPVRVVRSGVHIEHVFHVVDELPARCLWQTVLFLQPRFELVFFSVWRTVSCEMASTISSSTTLSASRRSDQRARPFGAGLQARVTRCASCTPSSLRGCSWREGRGRSAASKPSSTHRVRTRSTVERLTSKASAIASSLKRGPATPSSALSRIRACVSVRAAAFPFDSSSPNCARSSGVNFTRYNFMAQHFTGTRPHLSAILPGRSSSVRKQLPVCTESHAKDWAGVALQG